MISLDFEITKISVFTLQIQVYKNNKNHGEWVNFYNEDGGVEEKGIWEDGLKTGKFILKMSDGSIKEIQYQ